MADKLRVHNTEVLFQKLGDGWYLFTEIGEEVIYSKLPDGINPRTTKVELYELIEEHVEKVNHLIEAA